MNDTLEKPKKTKSKEDFLKLAHERFRLAEEAESEIRREALDDLEFRAGKQWPDDVKHERSQDGRPCLVINRMPQFIRHITNDQRQNRPTIKVFPVDDKADIETAKILQGMIKHIEYNSNADTAYDTAFEGAVTKGFGFFRVVTDYVDPMSFEQEILIKRIRNHFSVYLDPNSKEPDGSDAEWAFIFEDVPHDEFVAQYKNAKLSGMEDWQSIGNHTPGWATKSTCRVAEYFYKDYKEVTLVQLEDGSVVEKSELIEGFEYAIKSERKSLVPIVKWAKINGVEKLEETEWPSQYIPIIPVYGDELDVNGKRVLEGAIRHAKDSQRMYNYWASTETETISLAPRAPYIAAEGQISKEYESIWKSANRKNHAFLPYKPVSIGGQVLGAPQRNVFEAPIQSITTARLQAAEDLKATIGIYDAALGNRSNENSGIAIQRRTAQAQTANFHFVDNLTRSIRHAGRIIVELIPKIYDTARAVRILGEDGEQEIVRINEVFRYKGEDRFFNFTHGKYDTVVETGPSFATKRQEAAASMVDFMKVVPTQAAIVSDLIAKNMDWPGASEFAERLRKTLPPGIIEDKNKKPIPPEVQAQLQQMDQMIQQLTQQLNAASEAMKTKTMELESKERIEFAKMQVDLKKELLKQQGQAALATYEAELADLNRRLQLLDINEPIEEDFNEFGFGQSGFEHEQQQPTGGITPGAPMEF